MPVHTKKNGLVYCVYYDNGRRVWEPFGRGPNARPSAKARDMEIKLEKQRGQWAPIAWGISYGRLMEQYIIARRRELAPKTWDGILRAVTQYANPVIGKVPINQINMNHWHRIQSGMIDREIKNRTINTYFKYISWPLTWAVNENDDLLKEHPWTKRKALKEAKYNIGLFSLADFLKIMAVSQPHLAWIIELAYYTGARPGPKELFSLTWDRIDDIRSAILIDSAKQASQNSNPTRWQYLPPAYIKRLRRYQTHTQRKYPHCRHICHYRGQPVRSIKTAWRRAKTEAGITERIRLYDIRHYHITYALAAGADIKELADRVGHTTPKMIVDVYAHLAKDILKNQPHTLPNLHQNQLPETKMVDANSRRKKKAVSKNGLST